MIINIDKRTHGFTLIEVIIAMSILSIVILGVFSLFDFGNKMFTISNSQFEVQNDGRLALDNMINEIRYATELSIVDIATAESEISGGSSTYSYIVIKNSDVYKSTYDLVSSSRSAVSNISNNINAANSSFSKVSGSDDKIKIDIELQEGNQIYKIDTNVDLINLSVGSSANVIGGAANGFAIKYKIPASNLVLTPISTTLPTSTVTTVPTSTLTTAPTSTTVTGTLTTVPTSNTTTGTTTTTAIVTTTTTVAPPSSPVLIKIDGKGTDKSISLVFDKNIQHLTLTANTVTSISPALPNKNFTINFGSVFADKTEVTITFHANDGSVTSIKFSYKNSGQGWAVVN